ncbi:MAG: type II/IV secretion system ATPase subunit [Thermoplasmata archaeon]|nr:type II/IV secretion system ATPase subunit [Thermoplasmata archaeon]MCI4338286.1 type II/IV secretion system ATPase subunit [Thermoplasmata archaeon]MCI4340777.1 type II/IV secretion system ATPase subunit [Thermoplasmata archaeon]
MSGELAETPASGPETEEEAPRKARFSPLLRMGAAVRKGRSEPRPIRLAQLGLSGQGSAEPVTPIPPISDPDVTELEMAPIREGVSYVRISFHNVRNEHLYEVIEPPLSDIEKELLGHLKTALVDRFEPLPELDAPTKRRELRRMIDDLFTFWELSPSPTTKGRLLYHLERDFVGYGIVDVPMTDSEVEDISCDGVGIPLYIYHRKYGSIRSNLKFTSAELLDRYVIWLAQRSGKHISVASPLLDATVPDGSRLQATLGKHVTKRGSSFTVRRFRDNPFTPVDLLTFKTMSPEMMAYLWIAIQNGQSMMVCGGTASGKTTTLNATLLFIPPQMKIVSIEDTRELNLPHENWVPSLTRAGFGAKNVMSGKSPGEIDMFDLLATALRQRPQYLMVGEVRGAEAFIVFQAMATGKTCYTTFHAESVSAMVHRMENPPISLPRSLVSALNLVLLQRQVKVGTKMTRRVQSLTEIVGLDPETNELITNSVYSWNPSDDSFLFSGHSYIYERVALMKNWSMKEIEKEVRARVDVLEYMRLKVAQGTRQKPFTHRDVGRLVAFYYKDPAAAVAEARSELERARPGTGRTG